MDKYMSIENLKIFVYNNLDAEVAWDGASKGFLCGYDDSNHVVVGFKDESGWKYPEFQDIILSKYKSYRYMKAIENQILKPI